MQQIVDWVALAAGVSTALGLPIAIFAYIRAKRSEELAREYGTYDALDEKYHEYLMFCAEHPELNLYWTPVEEQPLSSEGRVRQRILFEVLTSLMERAYLMHLGQRQRMRADQWAGWDQYCSDWAARPRFRKLWAELGNQFDDGFTTYMNKKIKDVSPIEESVPGV